MVGPIYGNGNWKKIFHFEVVSFNGDYLFSNSIREDTLVARIYESPELLKFARGQHYVLVVEYRIMDERCDVGEYLRSETFVGRCRNRITVVIHNREQLDCDCRKSHRLSLESTETESRWAC